MGYIASGPSNYRSNFKGIDNSTLHTAYIGIDIYFFYDFLLLAVGARNVARPLKAARGLARFALL